MRRSQLAINSVSTGGAGLEERLAAYAAAGFENVEFMLGHVKDYLSQGHDAGDVRRLLDAHGLRCIGGFEVGLEAFSPPTAGRRTGTTLTANARLLAELGAATMVVGTDGPAGPVEDVVGALAEAFAAVADRIARHGRHPLPGVQLVARRQALRTAADVARRSGRANVGVLFDPAHYHCTPSKFEQLTGETVALIKHVHVDDMRDKPGELSDCNADRVLPGQGMLDLPALIGRIERRGYQGRFSIEMFSDDAVGAAARRKRPGGCTRACCR